jgi:hypothetical protein
MLMPSLAIQQHLPQQTVLSEEKKKKIAILHFQHTTSIFRSFSSITVGFRGIAMRTSSSW